MVGFDAEHWDCLWWGIGVNLVAEAEDEDDLHLPAAPGAFASLVAGLWELREFPGNARGWDHPLQPLGVGEPRPL